MTNFGGIYRKPKQMSFLGQKYFVIKHLGVGAWGMLGFPQHVYLIYYVITDNELACSSTHSPMSLIWPTRPCR